MDFLGLEGKTAIITGGSSNIGRGITLGFAEQGANVVVVARDEVQAQKVLQAANALGGNTIFIKTDVTDWDSVQAMVKQTLDKFGKIDILVNNVGWEPFLLFADPKHQPLWDRIINVNYRGDLNTLKAVLPHMAERKYGKIVNISSDAARQPEVREAVYAGCKAAVIALSKTLAREYGRYGININVVCPALIIPDSMDEVSSGSLWSEAFESNSVPDREMASKLYPLRRLGKPHDIANAVLFMASDRASYMTGQTISVDGGYTMI